MLLLIPLLMILAGVLLRIGQGLAYGVRGPEDDDLLYPLTRGASWFLIGSGFAIWSLLPLIGSVGALAIAVLLWVLIGFAVVDTVTSARLMYRRTNSTLLAIAIREGSLAQVAELLDQVRSGYFVRSAASSLAYELHSGTPLYESVARHHGALPREAAAYAAVGSLATAEPEALDELSRPEDAQLALALRQGLNRSAYVFGLLVTLGAFVAVYAAFIIPQFVQIFWEFDLSLPLATDALVGLTSFVSVWIVVLAALVLFLVGTFVVAVFYLMDMPVLRLATDRLYRSWHIASVLRLLALGLKHRVEMSRLLYALSITHPVKAIRNRLAGSYEAVRRGEPWAEALVRHRVITENEKALVDTAVSVGNLPWALGQIAHRRELRFGTRLTAVTSLVYPLLILALAGMVAFVCISLFVPLVKLVTDLT